MTKIIGIDPGLASTGVGMVRGTNLRVEAYSFTTIRTSKDSVLSARLNQIYEELFDIFKNEQPDNVIIEDIFSLKVYPNSGISLGKVSGVILLACSQLNIPVNEIPVKEAKKILTGNGNAGKEQLANAVGNILKRKTKIDSFHASDALALAIIGLFRNKGDH